MLAAMESRDSLTVLPTGGGKSLCYQAPAVCRDGMAIVVSPLIALMKDQVDALVECGIAAAFVNSSLTAQERQNVAARIRRSEIKLLFVAPERLVQERMLQFLEEINVSFIAIPIRFFCRFYLLPADHICSYLVYVLIPYCIPASPLHIVIFLICSLLLCYILNLI